MLRLYLTLINFKIVSLARVSYTLGNIVFLEYIAVYCPIVNLKN